MKFSQFFSQLGGVFFIRLVNWVFGQLLVNFSQLAFKKLNVFKENEVDHSVNFSQPTVELTTILCIGSQLDPLPIVKTKKWGVFGA